MHGKWVYVKIILLMETKELINQLGILPLIYNGNLDIITNYIDKLKNKYIKHIYFLNKLWEENMKYFINNSLFYSKYDKIVRSNSILENYNKTLKEQLGKKKSVNYMNYLNFIKSEKKGFLKNIILNLEISLKY